MHSRTIGNGHGAADAGKGDSTKHARAKVVIMITRMVAPQSLGPVNFGPAAALALALTHYKYTRWVAIRI
jgi:hypothetical protein